MIHFPFVFFPPFIPTHAGGAGPDHGHPEGEAREASGDGQPDQGPTGAG